MTRLVHYRNLIVLGLVAIATAVGGAFANSFGGEAIPEDCEPPVPDMWNINEWYLGSGPEENHSTTTEIMSDPSYSYQWVESFKVDGEMHSKLEPGFVPDSHHDLCEDGGGTQN